MTCPWNGTRCVRQICVLAAFGALFCSCGAANAMQRDPKPDANAGRRVASCILRATSNDETLPLDEEVLTALMMTSAVRGAATRDVLQLGLAENLDNDFVETSIEMIHNGPFMDDSNERYLRLRVSLEQADDTGEPIPPKADELLEAIVQRLRKATVELARQSENALRQRLAANEQRLDHAKKHLQMLLDKRRAISQSANRVDLSRASLVDEMRSLEDELRGVAIESAAHGGRRAAIENLIATTAERVNSAGANDPVLTELENLLHGSEDAVSRLEKLVDQGRATTLDLMKAREPLHELRIRIAERREALAARAGGDELSALNNELIELSISSAELEARSQQIKARLDELRPMLPLADALENEVLIQLPAAQEAVQERMERLQRLTAALETRQPPVLDVIGVGETLK